MGPHTLRLKIMLYVIIVLLACYMFIIITQSILIKTLAQLKILKIILATILPPIAWVLLLRKIAIHQFHFTNAFSSAFSLVVNLFIYMLFTALLGHVTGGVWYFIMVGVLWFLVPFSMWASLICSVFKKANKISAKKPG
jgi:hypothetical protein